MSKKLCNILAGTLCTINLPGHGIAQVEVGCRPLNHIDPPMGWVKHEGVNHLIPCATPVLYIQTPGHKHEVATDDVEHGTFVILEGLEHIGPVRIAETQLYVAMIEVELTTKDVLWTALVDATRKCTPLIEDDEA